MFSKHCNNQYPQNVMTNHYSFFWLSFKKKIKNTYLVEATLPKLNTDLYPKVKSCEAFISFNALEGKTCVQTWCMLINTADIAGYISVLWDPTTILHS